MHVKNEDASKLQSLRFDLCFPALPSIEFDQGATLWNTAYKFQTQLYTLTEF